MHHLSLGQKMQKGDYIRNNIDSTLIFEESGHTATARILSCGSFNKKL